MRNFIKLAASQLLFLLYPALLHAQIPTPAFGKIIRHENFSSAFIRSRNIDVWLPEGYSNSKKYAVIYMHDGQMLFDATITWNKQEWDVDSVIARLNREAKTRDCIVVGIWNTGSTRTEEYFPQRVFENLPDTVRREMINKKLFTRAEADNYLAFITRELKPFIDSVYSTLRDQPNTFIAGSSMGGLISLYAICEYPAVFGGAACLSTHWPGSWLQTHDIIPNGIMAYLRDHLPDPRKHRIYFDHGTATLDSLYKPYQEQVDAIMKTKGWLPTQWITLEFPGEPHTEQAWSRRLHIPLEFLLKK